MLVKYAFLRGCLCTRLVGLWALWLDPNARPSFVASWLAMVAIAFVKMPARKLQNEVDGD